MKKIMKTKKNKKTNKKSKKGGKFFTKKKIILTSFSILLILSLTTFFVLRSLVPFNVTVFSQEVGVVTYSNVEQKLNDILKNTKIEITNDDTVIEASLEDLGYSVKSDYVDTLREYDNIHGFNKDEVDLSNELFELDSEILTSKLNELNKDSKVQAADAYIKYENGSYVIVDEVISDAIEPTLALDVIIQNIEDNNFVVDVSDSKVTPEITRETLTSNLDLLNKHINRTITLSFGSSNYTITKDQISSFTKINKDGTYKIDSKKADTLFNSISNQYDSLDYSGGKRTEIRYNTYGLGKTLSNEVSAENYKVSLVSEVNTKTNTISQKKYGAKDTYIEVNISSQYMWFYKDGELVVSSPVVTGNQAKGYDTPTGTFTILEKQQNKTLNGATVGFDYSIPVSYWMRVTWDGIGFHDSTWNGQFDYGSDKYKTNGSHGCINLPLGVAGKLYENLDKDTTVYITP